MTVSPPLTVGLGSTVYSPNRFVYDTYHDRRLPITWHEGGHIIQGRAWGPFYLLIPLDYLFEGSMTDNVSEVVANALAPSLPDPEQGATQTGDACNGT